MFKTKVSGSWVEIHDATKEDSSNKSTTLDTTSDTKYPTCKAVYDYIESLDGNEISY